LRSLFSLAFVNFSSLYVFVAATTDSGAKFGGKLASLRFFQEYQEITRAPFSAADLFL
jgi:hypothetical protein